MIKHLWFPYLLLFVCIVVFIAFDLYISATMFGLTFIVIILNEALEEIERRGRD